LRCLGTPNEITGDRNPTVVFPIRIDLVKVIGGLSIGS
jgi:hypothetical protein